mgnify:CR=1 FL=1
MAWQQQDCAGSATPVAEEKDNNINEEKEESLLIFFDHNAMQEDVQDSPSSSLPKPISLRGNMALVESIAWPTLLTGWTIG